MQMKDTPINCRNCGLTLHYYIGNRKERWRDFTDERAKRGSWFWQHVWRCGKCGDMRVWGSEAIVEESKSA